MRRTRVSAHRAGPGRRVRARVDGPAAARGSRSGERVARGPGRARGGQHVAPARARVVDRRRRRRRRRVRARAAECNLAAGGVPAAGLAGAAGRASCGGAAGRGGARRGGRVRRGRAVRTAWRRRRSRGGAFAQRADWREWVAGERGRDAGAPLVGEAQRAPARARGSPCAWCDARPHHGRRRDCSVACPRSRAARGGARRGRRLTRRAACCYGSSWR
mmetsp:Transcript_37068/g.118865  ORF Transcript_37068/g.118865 Transcript_37068/m.118865 type:complete len:218 (-) Transcript_37068:433-1086(-)